MNESPTPLNATPTQKRKLSSSKDNSSSVKRPKVVTTTTYHLYKIVSGGQFGADRAGLEAAEALGLETGGYAPFGFQTSHGKCPELRDRFHLEELEPNHQSKWTTASMYVKRSMKNVDCSDATVAFRTYASAGTDKTIGYCVNKKWKKTQSLNVFAMYRPVLVIRDVSLEGINPYVKELREFLVKHEVKVLNVCGHREHQGGKWLKHVRNFLIQALLPCTGLTSDDFKSL